MSTITSCTLLSGWPAATPASSTGGRFQSGKPANSLPCAHKKSRSLSVCFANSPKGELGPFNIPAVALVDCPKSLREERWQMDEQADAVNMSFEVPGLSKEDLVVEIDEDVLVIKKKATTADPAAHDGGAGVYARLLVPAGYNRENVVAELHSGKLRVTIHKVKEHARRRINVPIAAK